MSFSYEKFLRPLRDTDKTIRVYDNNNLPVHTINPFAVLRVFATGLNCNIALTGNRVIVLDFASTAETKLAVTKFQQFVDTLKQKTPVIIDSGVERYIDTIIATSVGIRTFNGLTQSDQFLTVSGDSNLSIALITSGLTHSISLTFSGILPVEKGGLGNDNFTSDQLIKFDA